MAEKLGEAVLELRTDDSALYAGMSRAKAGAEDLQGTFVAAGARAGSSLSGLSVSAGAAGAAATQMAAQAQLSARAASGLARDAESATVAVTGLGNGSALATRELLVLVREASRGNFTRMAGSASILTTALQGQGLSIKGLVTNVLTMFGVLQTTTNAELAAEAAAAAASAEAVGLAAKRAAANVAVADTEIALAEAALRNAATATEATAAQARLAAAHEAVEAAAVEATIAEDALSVAQGRAAETGAASAATTRTMLGTTGAVLVGVAVAAVGAEGAFKALQATVDDSGALDRYAASLVKTGQQLDDLRDKVGGFQVTWGDVFNGLAKAAGDALGVPSIWDAFKEGNKNAFTQALHFVVDFGANSYGIVRGTYQSIVDIWNHFPGVIGDAFYSAVNVAIEALNKLVKSGVDQLNSLIATANKLPFVHLGNVSAQQIGNVGNPYAGQSNALGDALANNIPKFTKEARDRATAGLETVYDDIIGAAEDRIKGGLPKGRTARPKKPKRNAADDELAKLDAQIASENALTQAYLTSDAAVIKAEADQKAMTLAVEKHATASQTAALKQKELALAIATIADAGAKMISNLSADAAAREKVNAMVAAGLIPASQANQALQNELALRQQLAALTLEQEDLAQARHANDKQRIAEDIAAIARLQGIITGLPVSQAADDAAKNVADAQAQIAANDNEIAQLRLKNALLGNSNTEIAAALANLQAIQYLRDHPGIDASTAASLTQSYVDKAKAAIQTPFQQWAASVPQDAKAVGDALENDAVKGINDFNDGLAQAIVSGGSLFQVLHQGAANFLVDLIKLAEQEAEMALFKEITGAAGGGSAGGGINIGGGTSAFFSANPFGGFHAMGGLIPTGAFGIVGEKGPEPIIATPKGAMVLPNSTLRGMAANDSGPRVSLTNYNDFRGADADAVAAISSRIDQMEQDLPSTIVSTWGEANGRFYFRGKR